MFCQPWRYETGPSSVRTRFTLSQLYKLQPQNRLAEQHVIDRLKSFRILSKRGVRGARSKQINSPLRRQCTTVTKSESDNIRCIYVFNPTSLAKTNAFQQLVMDANSVSADIIIVVENWFKVKHSDNTFSISWFICFREDRKTSNNSRISVFPRHERHPSVSTYKQQ